MAYVSPDENSSDMEMGERWVVEYDSNGVQELMTSSELLVSLDSEASQTAREVTREGREDSDDEEEKEEFNPEESRRVHCPWYPRPTR